MLRAARFIGHAGSAGSRILVPEEDRPLTITLIGAGNSGHVCAALFDGNTGGSVRLQLLTGRPDAWSNMQPIVRLPDGRTQQGQIHEVSDSAAELIPRSDIVLWTGPVNATKEVFESIQPFLDISRTAVGTIFAQGLTHVLANRVFGEDVRFFALKNIPWLCRLVKAGEESEIVGAKTSIGVATMNLSEEWVKKVLEPLFVVHSAGKREPVMEVIPDFCQIVFNPANQIIHPACYWAMFRNWHGEPLTGEDEPNVWLYRGMPEIAGEVLGVLDEELQALKDAYFMATGSEGCRGVVPLKQRLLEQYGDQISDKSTLAKMVGTNRAYSMAKAPVVRTDAGVSPNPTHRVVVDDIGWGLCALVSIAERLEAAGYHTPTTMTRMLIEWHQKLMGKEFLVNGRLTGRDCKDLVLARQGDPLELVARVPARTVQPAAAQASRPAPRVHELPAQRLPSPPLMASSAAGAPPRARL